jgi:CO/xanthine dehydrogenase FAD-binding subunit
VRANLGTFAMRRARSLDEALLVLAGDPQGWRPFAGGTDLMVQLAAGALRDRQFVSLWGIGELRRIDETADAVAIGAMTTYTDVLRSGVVGREFPLLARAASETGGIANQNRGTIGGNVANASPAADTPPALLVYDAQIDVASTRGRRRIPYDQFHTGYKRMDLAPDEVITAVSLPRRSPDWTHYYRKVGARRSQAIAKVCLAGAIRLRDERVADVRLALGSVAPTVLRASRTESVLRGAALSGELVETAARTLASELSPIDDVRSTALYRSTVAQNLLREFLAGLVARPRPPELPFEGPRDKMP